MYVCICIFRVTDGRLSHSHMYIYISRYSCHVSQVSTFLQFGTEIFSCCTYNTVENVPDIGIGVSDRCCFWGLAWPMNDEVCGVQNR